MSKTSRNLHVFSWVKFSWTEMICVKNLHFATMGGEVSLNLLWRNWMILLLKLHSDETAFWRLLWKTTSSSLFPCRAVEQLVGNVGDVSPPSSNRSRVHSQGVKTGHKQTENLGDSKFSFICIVKPKDGKRYSI